MESSCGNSEQIRPIRVDFSRQKYVSPSPRNRLVKTTSYRSTESGSVSFQRTKDGHLDEGLVEDQRAHRVLRRQLAARRQVGAAAHQTAHLRPHFGQAALQSKWNQIKRVHTIPTRTQRKRRRPAFVVVVAFIIVENAQIVGRRISDDEIF